MRIVNRIAGIEGVAAGATVSFKLPVNRRYHALKLFTTVDGAATAASTVIDRVRMFVNGPAVVDATVARLLSRALLNRKTPAVGELPLPFSEPWRADKEDEQITAWDMFGETSFEVQLQMAAAPGGVPGVTGFAEFDYGQTLVNGQPVKEIIRLVEVGKNAVLGLNDFDNLPIRWPIQRVLLFGASAINSVEVTQDGNKVYEVTTAQNAAMLDDFGLDASQARFPICFDFTERITDSLRVARDLNVRFDSAAAQAVTALVESRAPGFIQ